MVYIILLSAFLGLYISGYFTLVYYRIIEPDSRWMPSFCRMKERECISILMTPYAKVFWLPNFIWGIAYYFSIIFLISSGALIRLPDVLDVLLGISFFTVTLGIYLTYALFFKIEVSCPLCLTSHAINLSLAVLFLFLKTTGLEI